VTDLAKNPRPVFCLAWRCGLVGHVHEFQRAINVAKQFAQVCSTSCSRQVSRAKIQHPLRCFFSVIVVANFDVCVGKETVKHDIVWCFLIQLFRLFECSRKLMSPEKEPDRRPFSIKVLGRNFKRFPERVLRLRVKSNVGGLARPAR